MRIHFRTQSRADRCLKICKDLLTSTVRYQDFFPSQRIRNVLCNGFGYDSYDHLRNTLRNPDRVALPDFDDQQFTQALQRGLELALQELRSRGIDASELARMAADSYLSWRESLSGMNLQQDSLQSVTDQRRGSPIDFPLLEGIPLDGGAVFVRLPTLDALQQFARGHLAVLPYSAEGAIESTDVQYLHETDWVFAPTKQAVVRATMRWDLLKIGPSWYDQKLNDPKAYASFQADFSAGRTDEILAGTWTAAKERHYRREIRSTGWWQFVNLPPGAGDEGWSWKYSQITNPAATNDQLCSSFQEYIFDRCDLGGEIFFRTASGLKRYIRWNVADRARGIPHYGCPTH